MKNMIERLCAAVATLKKAFSDSAREAAAAARRAKKKPDESKPEGDKGGKSAKAVFGGDALKADYSGDFNFVEAKLEGDTYKFEAYDESKAESDKLSAKIEGDEVVVTDEGTSSPVPATQALLYYADKATQARLEGKDTEKTIRMTIEEFKPAMAAYVAASLKAYKEEVFPD